MFDKWQQDNDCDHQMLVWYHCELERDNVHVALYFCERFKDSIISMQNFQMTWITGTTNQILSTCVMYKCSMCIIVDHVLCVYILKKMSGHFKNMSGQTHVTPHIFSGHPKEVIIVPVMVTLLCTCGHLSALMITLLLSWHL